MASLGLVCPSEVRAVGTSPGSSISAGGDGGSANQNDFAGDIVASVTSSAGNDTQFSTTGVVSVVVEQVYGDTVGRTSPDSSTLPGDTVWFNLDMVNAGNGQDTLVPTAIQTKYVVSGQTANDSVQIGIWNSAGTAQIGGVSLPADGLGSFKVSVYVKVSAPRNDTLSITVQAAAKNGAGGDPGGYTGNNGVLYAGDGDDTAALLVRVLNTVPVANAGLDTTGSYKDTKTLNGAASTDPNGDILTYLWTQVSGPAVTIISPASTVASFYADSVGTFGFQLAVSDGFDTSVDTVSVTAVNDPPVADAGPDTVILPGDTVVLDGSVSFDLNGDALYFKWTQQSGAAVTLTDSTVTNPAFVSDTAFAGDYVFQLVVTDAVGDTSADTVMVSAGNVAPIADAGLDTSVPNNDTVTLDGTFSFDANLDTLTYAWTQLSGPSVVIVNPAAAIAQVYMETDAVYVFKLAVNDGVDSSADTVQVTVLNTVPIAVVGPDSTVVNNDTVVLDGAASADSDIYDIVTYQWTQLSGPAVAIQNPTASVAGVYLTAAGVYAFQLKFGDGQDTSVDTVQVTVTNTTPIANAGPDSSVVHPETVVLDGAASIDPDGADTLSYTWAQVGGPATALSNAFIASPSFQADTVGTYIFTLTVTDGVDTSVDTVQITATNTPPTANAGLDTGVATAALVQLDGSASTDPNGDPVTYQWTQIDAAPAMVFSPSATVINPTIQVDTVFIGNYIFQLAVTDGFDTSLDTVLVSTSNVPPVADAGTSQVRIHPDTVSLSGLGSSDLNGDTLTYLWSQVGGPNTLVITGATTATPSVYVDSFNVYTFQLLVVDSVGDTSAPDTVTVTGLNTAPVAAAGANQTAVAGDTVTLNGSASSDTDGDRLSFFWTQISGPGVTLSAQGTASPYFIPTISGVYIFELAVQDGMDTGLATTNVTVGAAQGANLSFGADTHQLFTGGSVSLAVTVRDVNGNLVEGETVTFALTHPASDPNLILSPNPAFSGSSGVATVFVTLGSVSSFYRIEASLAANPSVVKKFYVYNNKLEFLSQSSAGAGLGWKMWSYNGGETNPSEASAVGAHMGVRGTDYNIYEWQTGTSNSSLNNTAYQAPSTITRGRAYWVKNISATSKVLTVTPPDTTPSETVTVSLSTGWNQVGSGQFFFVDWASAVRFYRVDGDSTEPYTPQRAQDSNLIKNAAYWWDAADSTYNWGPDTLFPNVHMKPMAGFWVYAETPVVMKIMPTVVEPLDNADILNQAPSYGGAPSRSLAAYYQNVSASDQDWAVQISAAGGGVKDMQNYVGVKPNASLAQQAARYEPPGFASGYLMLGFRADAASGGSLQAAAYADPVTTAKAWDVEVLTDIGQPVTLTWNNLESIPEQYSVILVTPTGNVDMRKSGSYQLAAAASQQKTTLTFAVGLPEYLGALLAAPLAKDESFVYPNPGPDGNGIMNFKHNVTAGTVKITIYDVGGKLVKEISGTGSPIQWDTTNRYGQKVGSGVYIYIMETDGAKLIDKLAVVR